MLPRGNAQMAQWLMAAKVGVTPNYRSQTLLYLWFFKPKMPYPTPPKKRIPPEKLKRYSFHPNFALLGLERSRCQGCLAKGTPDKQSLAGKVVTKIPKQKKKNEALSAPSSSLPQVATDPSARRAANAPSEASKWMTFVRLGAR